MKEVIFTDRAPQAIGAYSQAMRVGDTVYLSGQIPLHPKTMQLCSSEIKVQINQVLDNLSAVCAAAGGSLADVVKLTVYLTDLQHFSFVNDAIKSYFPEPFPARAVIGVAALPKGAEVEIEGVMILKQPL